jgi:hypothetical protein
VPAGHDAGAAGQTTGGLARRVRGAQLPSATPAPIPRGEVPPDIDERAGDVNGFLSQFSAGVQRGLDETRGDGDDRRPPAAPDPFGPYDS